VRSHVYHGVYVSEGNAGKVPEDDHEAPFLMIHIPRLGDALLSLGTGVDIQTRGEDHECHVRGNVAIDLVLLAATTDRDHEQQHPRDPHFSPHLQIDASDTRVQTRAHEQVVGVVPAHPHLLASGERNDVDTD